MKICKRGYRAENIPMETQERTRIICFNVLLVSGEN